MRLKTVTGQVTMTSGRRYDQADGILVDERASRFAKGRGRGNLYVLVEMGSGQQRLQAIDHDGIVERLIKLICDTYYSQRGSMTASLQQAVRVANSLLFDYNRNSMPAERRMAGVSCVVLRDEDLFIAQAGPAALYVAHEEQVTRFPDASPWLDNIPLEEVDAAPLGSRHDVHVDLFHIRVSDGDVILLVDSGLAFHVAPHAWPDILAITPVEALLRALLAVSEGGDMSALLVTLSLEESVQATTELAPPTGEQVPKLVLASARTPMTSVPKRSRMADGVRTARQALASFWVTLWAFLRRMAPSQPRTSQTSRRKATTVRKPEKKSKKQPTDRMKPGSRSDAFQKLLVGIAIAIPLVVAAIVILNVVWRGQAQKSELEELWLDANARWVQAQALGDPVTVRALLTEADEYLNQLLERQPDHAEALALRQRITARLDETNQVRRVRWEGDLMSYPADAHLTRVVVEGVHVFVMDRNGDQVYHHQLDEFQQALQPDTLDTVLVRKGAQVGDVLVGDLVDMTWMPVGNGRQEAGLVILESGGALLEYDPATDALSSLQVAGSETWQLPELVGSHSGRFYLLDSVGNGIWRYTPSADGYSTPPVQWLKMELDLTGVRDMAVGDSIFLLYADGGIRKLTGGELAAFDITDWDVPPQDPTAIFTRPPNETQWVYVADTGNNRIVQANKGGQFKRQFRLTDSENAGSSDTLAGVTSLFIDEIGGRAYFLSGQKLYMIILPN